MPRHMQVRRKTLGDKIGAAIAGVFVGIALFLTSFGVLWWNEGRTDMSKVAAGATITAADQIDTSLEGQLVSVSGTLDPQGTVEDPEYLKPATYMKLNRQVEMFAWVEHQKKQTKKQVGGGEIEYITYDYTKEWTSHPSDSSHFEYSEDYVNPELTIEAKSFSPEGATLGAWRLDPSEATLPRAERVKLAASQLKYPKTKKARRQLRRSGVKMTNNEEYLFRGKGSLENPRIGDVRISWTAVPAGLNVTMFAQAGSGSGLVPYLHKGKDRLYRAITGTHDEAVATLATEHKVITWMLRIVGFLMMWIGMSLVFGPLHAFADIIPFVGDSSRFLVGLVLFPVALVLSVLTMIISLIAHNIIALLITFILLVGGGVAFYLIRKRSSGGGAPQPAPAAA